MAIQTMEELYPALAVEYSKNNVKDFNDYRPKSNKKVEWVCSTDSSHVWGTSIEKRTRGTGCPFCGGSRVQSGVNDFKTLYPTIAREWSHKNTKGADQYLPGSDYKAIWTCDNGHETVAQIKSRTRGSKCSYCVGKLVAKGENDLKTLHPEIASEWSSKNPKGSDEYRDQSNAKVWWKCYLGHEWQAVISNRVLRRNGCPYCSGSRTITSKAMMESLYPDLAEEWGDLNSSEDFSVSGNNKIWWKCQSGSHEYRADISTKKRGRGCPICANFEILVGFNDLETTHPTLASEWSPKNAVSAVEVVAGSNQRFWWQCLKGHDWETTVSHRAYSGTDCPVCSLRTSKVEVQLADKMSIFGEVVQQAKTISKWPNGQKMTADVLLDDKVCIEYDGSYWHSDKVHTDKFKTLQWIEDGYFVIRFRDTISLLDIDHPNLLQLGVEYSKDPSHLDEAVETSINWMSEILG